MGHLIRSVSALALSATLLGSVAHAQDDEDSKTLYRVFVGDHKDPKVTAFDLSKPEKRWTFNTVGQNKLYSVNEGASVVAVQSDNDAVNFINSGITLHSHGDHSDIEITDPQVVTKALTGPRPFHVIDHNGRLSSTSTRAVTTKSLMHMNYPMARLKRHA